MLNVTRFCRSDGVWGQHQRAETPPNRQPPPTISQQGQQSSTLEPQDSQMYPHIRSVYFLAEYLPLFTNT